MKITNNDKQHQLTTPNHCLRKTGKTSQATACLVYYIVVEKHQFFLCLSLHSLNLLPHGKFGFGLILISTCCTTLICRRESARRSAVSFDMLFSQLSRLLRAYDRLQRRWKWTDTCVVGGCNNDDSYKAEWGHSITSLPLLKHKNPLIIAM